MNFLDYHMIQILPVVLTESIVTTIIFSYREHVIINRVNLITTLLMLFNAKPGEPDLPDRGGSGTPTEIAAKPTIATWVLRRRRGSDLSPPTLTNNTKTSLKEFLYRRTLWVANRQPSRSTSTS